MVVGLLVLSGLIPADDQADRRLLAWHAYLWDPWFFLWGMALMTTLWLTRRPGPRPAASRPAG
jgi:hypothetical protein